MAAPPPISGGGVPLVQASSAPDGSTGSTLNAVARVVVPNPHAQFAVVLIHGLNSSPETWAGQTEASWAQSLPTLVHQYAPGLQVEVISIGWQTTPTNSANTSTSIRSAVAPILKAIFGKVKNRSWIAVGHSMGGLIIRGALGTAFRETNTTGGNPITSDPRVLASWRQLLTSCRGILLLASPSDGSPLGAAGAAAGHVIPGANPAQMSGLRISSRETSEITSDSNMWFVNRQGQRTPLNVFAAQETQGIGTVGPRASFPIAVVDFPSSQLPSISIPHVNYKDVQLPGETHTSAPKVPATSANGKVLVGGVIFCITGRFPQEIPATPGRTRPGVAGTIASAAHTVVHPSANTLRQMLPGQQGPQQPGAGGSGDA
ncbi:hypothetical protein CLCR_03528 [Cladophialophora carrionii]|uniref:Uncharacterized protein n=1 Tax=Cladophialophora carrionii TaxID=86049 RepID=A0A1C1CFS6_9EURO|nr:hypothetical protein CLCR_03528 [Cladophialophora carrionii]